MNTKQILVLVLALAVTMVFMTGAYAADKAAAPAGKEGKTAAPRTEVKCQVSGKLESKMVTNKKTGKEHKVFHVTVAEAKGADGKALDALKGKKLPVNATKGGVKLGSFDGKDVSIAGTLINDRKIVVDTIK